MIVIPPEACTCLPGFQAHRAPHASAQAASAGVCRSHRHTLVCRGHRCAAPAVELGGATLTVSYAMPGRYGADFEDSLQICVPLPQSCFLLRRRLPAADSASAAVPHPPPPLSAAQVERVSGQTPSHLPSQQAL